MPCLWCKRGAPATAFAALVFGAVFSAAAPVAAQFDPGVMQKWMDVTVVHYAVTGEFAAKSTIVPAGMGGFAEVADRVEFDFDWDQTTAMLAGEPSVRNFPTTLSNLRNGEEGCKAPTLHGPYEHFTVLSLKNGLSGQLEMTTQQDYPAADIPQVCDGKTESVAAKSVTETDSSFVVPGVMILAMPVDPNGKLTVSADKTTMTFVDKGWTWTYRPTPVR